MYTDQQASQPTLWEESDPKYVNHSNQVKLSSFTTKIHTVNTMVTYREVNEEEEEEQQE